MRNRMRTKAWFVLLVVIALSQAARAEIKLPAIFGDHMVLQRDAAAPIWGTAAPGESVTVEFAGQKQTATADAKGQWMVKLAPLPASAEPREMKVGSLVFRDVLVGEIWLAGGQSNMGLSLSGAHNAAEAIAQASDTQLRLFKVALKTAAEPQTNVSGQWQLSAPDSAKGFSAVAYFFAKELRRTLGCPIGVIGAPWGGTPIQTWISLDGLKKSPVLTRTLADWEKAVAQYRKIQAEPELVAKYEAELKRWRKEVEPAFNAATRTYNADKAAGKPVGERPQPAWPEPQNPDPMGMPSPSRRPQTPAVSFNAMIAPLAPYALRGVIWYQGEANGNAGLEYRTLFPRLIQDWRAHWGTEFHFLFVQLPSFGEDPGPVAQSGWPWLREAQALTLREPRTSMAITIDVGNPKDVHPTNKLDVGNRLALLARRDVYGQKLVASGPLYRDFAIKGDTIRVRFRETGSGLTIGQSPWLAPGVTPIPTDKLIGFFIAGEDRQWKEASAKINGDSVIVSSPAVPKPVAVRYGWANSPRCNLYNKEGLPASPFRTDDWEARNDQ